MEVVRQILALGDHGGFESLARLIVEDSDRDVEWNIEQTFREANAQLSKGQAQSLTLSATIPPPFRWRRSAWRGSIFHAPPSFMTWRSAWRSSTMRIASNNSRRRLRR